MKRGKPMRRTPMKRAGSSSMKRSAMKPKPRRGGRMPEEVYHAVMLQRAGGRCEGALPGICTGNAEEWHHRQPRDRYNDSVQNGAALCGACHDYITDTDPALGFERGLRVSRHLRGDPGEVPMLQFGRRWVILRPDGSVEPSPREALDEKPMTNEGESNANE